MKKRLKSSSSWDIFPKDRKLFIWVLMAMLLGCGGGRDRRMMETPYPVEDSWGTARHYRLFIPRQTTEPAPLMVYFHGVRSPGFQSIPALKNYSGSPVEETGLIPFCSLRGIYLLVPEPAYTYRFLGQVASGWLPYNKEAEGIERIIDTVIEHYPISPDHIYLAGISAGAGMCHHLGNRRPHRYNAILSHSQGYLGENDRLLPPAHPGPQFGVVFGFTRDDYDNLIEICRASERLYRENGYRTTLLENLPAEGHAWSTSSNRRFWRWLKALGRHPLPDR